MHLAINDRTDSYNDWSVWLNVPDQDIAQLVEWNLYDDSANPKKVDVHTWEDETPSSVQAAYEAGYIDGLP